MLNSQNLIDKICAKISCGGLTSLQTCQTTGALNILSNPVLSVATFNDLPNGNEYTGRLIYVNDENRYYYAIEGYWISNLNSEVFNFADGVWAWGCNSLGRLGDNTTVDKSSPVSVVNGFTDWCQASAGGCHSLAVRSNGSLWAWGFNNSGQLGDNTAISKNSPVSVVGGFTDWCQASAASSHSLGLRSNGTLWAWGSSFSGGKLGDGTTATRSSPVSVAGGFTDWCQASAGADHSLGVRQNGTLWAWGTNTFGRLGNNCTTNRCSPVSVVGGFTDWCQASAGGEHSLGVRANGTLWAWGSNSIGRLGDNTTVSKSSPVSVVGGFTDWCQASAGGDFSLGLRSNGTLWSWGNNVFGQLGHSLSRSSPVLVSGGFADWCQVSAGYRHGLGVRANGTLWAWGNNCSGRLGDNTTISKNSPVPIVGGFTDWCQVSGGNSHSLGVRQICKGF